MDFARNTFASHYVMRDGSLVKLQAILGHASIRTMQVYAHLAPDHLSGATSILEGLGLGNAHNAQRLDSA